MLETTMFSTLPKANFNFWVTFELLSEKAFNLDQSKIFGKELTSTSVMRKVCFDMSKVKVIVDLVQKITSTFIYGFKKNLAHLFFLTSSGVIREKCFNLPKVTVEGHIFKLTFSEALLYI